MASVILRTSTSEAPNPRTAVTGPLSARLYLERDCQHYADHWLLMSLETIEKENSSAGLIRQDSLWDHGQASAQLRPTSSNCPPHRAAEHLQNTIIQ